MHEVWKRINLPNIKQGYVISTRGRFKYNSDILSEDKYYQSSNGYKYIILEKSYGTKQTLLPIDDLLGLAFIQKPKGFDINKFHIEHINGDTTDISIDNLIWVKTKEFWVPVIAPIITKNGNIINVLPNTYKVSNLQRVYSELTHNILKPHFDEGYIKYHMTYLLPNGERKAYNAKLHRIMAESFDIPGKSDINNIINHIDGDKTKCDLKNLEWVSNMHNVNHAFMIGLEVNPVGEKHPRAKFLDNQRKCIYEILKTIKTIQPAILLIFIKQRLPNTSLDDVKYAKQVMKHAGEEFPILQKIVSKDVIRIYNENKQWLQPMIDNIFDKYGIYNSEIYVNKYKNKEIKVMPKIKDDKYNIIKNDVARIRQVPTMYISSIGEMGAFHLCKEIIDNNYDECYKKDSPADHIEIYINDDEITTRDNGRGIPLDIIREVFETLQAGSNMEKAGGETRGVNGAGSTCVLALSSYLKIVSMRANEKKKLTLIYKDSIIADEQLEDYDGKDHGLIVTFRPSKKALGVDKIPVDRLVEWLKDFNYTLPKRISMEYTIRGKKTVVEHRELSEFFDENINSDNLFCKPLTFECEGKLTESHLDKMYDRHVRIKASFVYTNPDIYHGDDLRCSWMNTINTVQHGSHLDGCINGFIKYMTEKVYAKNRKLDGEDIKKDILAHLNVVVKADCDLAHMFSAQAKDRVLSKPLEKVISEIVYKELESTYNSMVSDMVEIIVGNHRARIEGEKARSLNAITKEKKKWTQPDTFYPASTVKTPQPKEIFLVEGESAGGGLKFARDAKFQALLCFRGKSLNVMKNNVDVLKAMKSLPLENLTKILGCGIGPTFDIKKLKYERIIIATDADIDGYHIRTILLTFFFIFMPDLIREGHVYVVEPPLYELKHGKNKLYVGSTGEYIKVCINSVKSIQVQFPGNKKVAGYTIADFLTEAFDYRDVIVAQSYERYVNRYLLEHIAHGFAKYGSVDNFIENVDDWLRSLAEIYPEIGFDRKSNQIHATIDLVDQLVVIDEKLFKDVQYIIDVINKFGITLKFKTPNDSNFVSTTLLRFFEVVEDMYPKILQRYKGLGSSQPIITRDIVTDPRTRRVIKITMNNINTYDRIGALMGDSKDQKRARKELLMEFPFTKDMLDN